MAKQANIVKPDKPAEISNLPIVQSSEAKTAKNPAAAVKTGLNKTALGLGLIFVIVVIVVVVLVVHGHDKTKTASKVAPKSQAATSNPPVTIYHSNGRQSQSQLNDERQNDVSVLAAGINHFIASHNNALPAKLTVGASQHGVSVCDSECSSPSPVTLGLYDSKNISIKAYDSKLVVPSVNDIYVVNEAYCNPAANGLGPQYSASPMFAILYAFQNGSSLKPECMTG